MDDLIEGYRRFRAGTWRLNASKRLRSACGPVR